MRSQNPNEDRGMLRDTVATLNVAVALIQAVGHIHALFTRRFGSMGREYPNGFVSVAGIIFVPLVAVMLAPPIYGCEFIWPYLFLVYLLAILHGVAKHRQKQHVHRHYIGDPWITIGEPGSRKGEWLLGWILIVLFFVLSNTLGILHLVSLVCNAMSQDMLEARDKRIVHQMRDSQLEAEYYANRLNGL